jgi:hypothetical protein
LPLDLISSSYEYEQARPSSPFSLSLVFSPLLRNRPPALPRPLAVERKTTAGQLNWPGRGVWRRSRGRQCPPVARSTAGAVVGPRRAGIGGGRRPRRQWRAGSRGGPALVGEGGNALGCRREAGKPFVICIWLARWLNTHKVVFFSIDLFSPFVLFLRFIIVIAKKERNCKEENVLQELHSFDFASYKLMSLL